MKNCILGKQAYQGEGFLGTQGRTGEASWAAKAYQGWLQGRLGLSREAVWAVRAYQGRPPRQLKAIMGGLLGN